MPPEHTQHKVNVRAGPKQAFFQPAIGCGQHARIKNLQLRLDTLRRHGVGKSRDVSGRVKKHVIAKIDRTHGQACHLWSHIHRGQALLRRHAYGSASGHLNDHVAARAHRGNDVAVNRRILGGAAIGLSCVQVDDGCTRLDAGLGRQGNFLRGDGQGRLIGPGDFGAGQSCGDDEFVHGFRHYCRLDHQGRAGT
jgi:hypothetical protein